MEIRYPGAEGVTRAVSCDLCATGPTGSTRDTLEPEMQ